MRVQPKVLVRRLNPTCTKVLEEVVNQAASGRFYEIGPENLLLGLVSLEDGDVGHILHYFRKDPSKIVAEVERVLQMMRTGNQGKPTFSATLWKWIEDAWVIASLERSAVQLRGADLFLQFLDNMGAYTGESFPALESIDTEELKRDWEAVIAASKETLEVPTEGQPAAPGQTSAPGREALDRFTVSFTDRAKRGDIDPIFGRDREIRQVIDILARRRKNNPMVVGEPGVGKTALVEGLARAIVAKEVPEELHGVELVGLDLGLLKAGAGVKGELENRLKKVIAEVKGSPTPIIVFIDEAHTLIGGAGDAGEIPNLLKPALARGEFRTVAATTLAEFKKYIEKDAALERRFQPVIVEQPTVETAAVMLRGLRDTYETAHKVTIRDDAVLAAVELSERYISGRQLPDKAVDLLDTAAARVRMEQAAKPERLTTLASESASLERELFALQRDLDDGAAVDEDGRVGTLEGRLADIAEEVEQTEARLVKEREAIEALLEAQIRLRVAKSPAAAEEAPTEQDEAPTEGATESDTAGAEAAGEEGAGDAPSEADLDRLRAAAAKARDDLAELQGESPLVHAEVDRDAIAQVIADWTGIPVGKMKASAIDVILNLDDSLRTRIKGQDHAVNTVSEMIRMSHAGVRNPDTPIAVMLFVGPSGVGKTETALALADQLYGGERSMITINMSEFQEKHTVSRLIGSPPGYVGYGEGGLLTEAVRHKPYSVVLLDEVEKADLEVMNLFYQVFDKGVLNDSEGRAVDFRNTVVILTSNLGTEQIMALCEGERPDVDTIVDAIRPVLSNHFKPALLARMTVVPYGPMDPAILTEIAHLKLGKLAERLTKAHGVTTRFDDALIAELVSRCTEGETGARALDHAMRGSLMPVLARGLLEKMAGDGVPKNLEVGLADGAWDLRFS